MTKVSIGTVWFEQQRSARVDIMYDEDKHKIYYGARDIGVAVDIEDAVRTAKHMFYGPAWDYRPTGE